MARTINLIIYVYYAQTATVRQTLTKVKIEGMEDTTE